MEEPEQYSPFTTLMGGSKEGRRDEIIISDKMRMKFKKEWKL